MNHILIQSKNENSQKIMVLATRLNTVASKLNNLSKKIAEYELQKSEYILQNEKFRNGALLIDAICRDIDALLDEEKSINQTLSTLNKTRLLKKHKLEKRLEEINSEINNKENQLIELKKSGIKASSYANFAKQRMDKLEDVHESYFSIIANEYNPIVRNINKLAGTNLSLSDGEAVEQFEPLSVSFENSSSEEME